MLFQGDAIATLSIVAIVALPIAGLLLLVWSLRRKGKNR